MNSAMTSFLPAGICYRALRRLHGQDLHLEEQRVFQDAPCAILIGAQNQIDGAGVGPRGKGAGRYQEERYGAGQGGETRPVGDQIRWLRGVECAGSAGGVLSAGTGADEPAAPAERRGRDRSDGADRKST